MKLKITFEFKQEFASQISDYIKENSIESLESYFRGIMDSEIIGSGLNESMSIEDISVEV